MSKRKKLPTNQTIGARIKAARIRSGISMPKLGDAVGVSPQMIHKYQKGTSSVSAVRLALIAHVVGCPVANLLEA